jgi:ABC-2 type transport system permease protein
MSSIIFRNELRRHRTSFIVWGIVLPLLTLFRMAEYPSFADQYQNADEALGQFSETEIEAFGLADVPITEVLGYYGGRIYSLVLLLGGVYIIMLAATILSKEEDDKTVEFLLAKPVTRGAILGGKFLCVAFYATAMTVWLALTNLAMFEAFKEESYSYGVFALFTAGTLLVFLAFAVVGFLLSVFVVRARSVYPITIGLVLAAYFVLLIANSSEGGAWLRYLSFFSYVEADDLIRDEAIGVNYLVLFAVVVLGGLGLSYWAYRRKDITA